jgi:6-phospho-3-hexuloisomerase
MMQFQNLFDILDELRSNSTKIDADQVHSLEDLIFCAKRVFIAGAGRSGFVAKAFANRLMHLGFQVYVTGETTTPSIQKDDLLVLVSGSGNTSSLISNGNVARKQGAKIAAITMFPENTIVQMADAVVFIPGTTKKSNVEASVTSIQMPGSSFEELSWLLFDAIAMELICRTDQSYDDLFARHANME